MIIPLYSTTPLTSLALIGPADIATGPHSPTMPATPSHCLDFFVPSSSGSSQKIGDSQCLIPSFQAAFRPWRLDPELVSAFQKNEAAFIEFVAPLIETQQELPLHEFSRRWGLNEDHQYTLTTEWEHLTARKIVLKGKTYEERRLLTDIHENWDRLFTGAFIASQGDLPFIHVDNPDSPAQMTFYLIPPEFLLRLPYLIFQDRTFHYAPCSRIVSIDENARLAMRAERTIYSGDKPVEIHGGHCLPYLATFHDIIHTIEASTVSFESRTRNLKFQALISSLTGLSPEQKECAEGLRTLLIDQRNPPFRTYERYFGFLEIFMPSLVEPRVLRAIYQKLPHLFASDPDLPELAEGFRSVFRSAMSPDQSGGMD